MTKLELVTLPQPLAICRLSALKKAPKWVYQSKFLSITQTANELSIVCDQKIIPKTLFKDKNTKIEASWQALKVKGPLDFTLTGILNSLTTPLAKAGISLFALSTYDTDYILIKKDFFKIAQEILVHSGHNISSHLQSKKITQSKKPSTFKLKITNQVYLSEITPKDKRALLKHLKNKKIYDNTLTIPYPYTLKDAEEWIKKVSQFKEKYGTSTQWAIRNQKGYLIGVIGIFDLYPDQKPFHRAEIGYWLAEPYWNKGLMTKILQATCKVIFKKFKLTRLTANVFVFNPKSVRVLEKVGFQLEGRLRKHYVKANKVFDGLLFSKTKK